MLKMTWTKNAEGRVVGVWMAATKSANANGAIVTMLRTERFPNTSASRGEMPVALAA
jgi:hypothetical protein